MSAHILVIADGRSPTARSWIANVQSLGYEISLISTFTCDPPAGMRHFYTLPVALSRLSSNPASAAQSTAKQASQKPTRSLIRRFASHFQSLRYIIGPLTLLRFASAYQYLVRETSPDLVHALRIPFEGMLGSYTPASIPFLASTWGNDLTLHASGSPLMRAFTKRCLKRSDGFTADTHRDTHLAQKWGLPADSPTLVVPGSGGLDLDAILTADGFDPSPYGIPLNCDWVVNPRGLRPGSVHQDVFFAAIPEVLAARPDTHFICPNLDGNHKAQAWVDSYGIGDNTHLIPKLPQHRLWSLLKSSQLYVSPSSHDGTPNSLLEAMASGCFPVVGDIESLREWIEQGINGILINPHDPQSLAAGICQALEATDLRESAVSHNLTLVKTRAAQSTTRPLIDAFYQQFIG